MDNLEEINSEMAKQETDDEDSEITDGIEQEYHCKQEPEEEWDEKTLVFDGLIEKLPFVSERPIHVFHAKVCAEKPPRYTFEKCPVVKEEPTAKRIRKKSRKLIESLESLEFEKEKDPEPTLDEHAMVQNQTNSKRVRKKSKKLMERLESEHSEQLNDISEPIFENCLIADEAVPTKSKRGRKRKNQFVESLESIEIKQEISETENCLADEGEPTKPKRGRKRKNQSVESVEFVAIKQEIIPDAIPENCAAPEQEVIKPKRGRKRKNHAVENLENLEIKQENILADIIEEEPLMTATKRIRKKSKKFLEFLETIKLEDEILDEASEKEYFTDEEYLNDEEYFTDKEYRNEEEYVTDEESVTDEEYLNYEKRPAKKPTAKSQKKNENATVGSEVERGEKRAFVGLYQKICPECKTVTPTGLRPKGIRVRAARDCEKCLVKLIFQCKKCKRQVVDFPSIRKHLIAACSSIGYHYKCLACTSFNFVAMYKEDIERHIRRRHPYQDPDLIIIKKQNGVPNQKSGNTYPCSKCPQSFVILSGYLKHSQICGDSTEKMNKLKEIEKMCYYVCKECNNKITKFETIEECNKKECDKCESKLSHVCKECEKLFTSIESFYMHFKALHTSGKVTYECPKCTFSTSNFVSLTSHYRRAHGMKSDRHYNTVISTCRKCHKFRGTREDLREHVPDCMRPMMKCNHCSFKTKYKSCLVKHFEHKHILRDGIVCTKCNRKYKNETSMRDHLRYCGKQPYLFCEKCLYKTSFKSAIVRHKLTMHPEKSAMKGFACTLCGKLFQYDSVRKAHEYNHRKKRLCCNDCSYRTISWRGLINHLKNMHIHGKGQRCKLCGTTVRKERHLKLHSRYCFFKPYFECDHCIFRTQQRNAFVRHIRCHNSTTDKSPPVVSQPTNAIQPIDIENVNNIYFKVDVANE